MPPQYIDLKEWVMKNKLEGKIAVITGASSGIGLAVARRLHSCGVKIFNISRSKIDEDIFEKSFECDITDDKKVEQVASEIVGQVGKIDFLLCNAGMGIGGLVEHSKLQDIQRIMDVNLTATMKFARIFIEHINENGKIVFTGSVASFIPLPYQACYSASKAGLLSFSRALATELKPRKIKVTTIMPCDTKTGFTDARIKTNSSDAKENHGIVKMEKWERNGKSPDVVAKVFVKVLKKKNPPLKVTDGAIWGFVYFLVGLLPTKFVNWLVEKIYV